MCKIQVLFFAEFYRISECGYRPDLWSWLTVQTINFRQRWQGSISARLTIRTFFHCNPCALARHATAKRGPRFLLLLTRAILGRYTGHTRLRHRVLIPRGWSCIHTNDVNLSGLCIYIWLLQEKHAKIIRRVINDMMAHKIIRFLAAQSKTK